MYSIAYAKVLSLYILLYRQTREDKKERMLFDVVKKIFEFLHQKIQWYQKFR